MERIVYIGTPVGRVGIAASDDAVTRIFFAHACGPAEEQAPEGTPEAFTPLLRQAAAVWDALRTIPYGESRSYKQIAAQIGRPTACRAVGMANNRNPIAIVVPCHRVVGSGGTLVGYAGGLEAKAYLLGLERENKG